MASFQAGIDSSNSQDTCCELQRNGLFCVASLLGCDPLNTKQKEGKWKKKRKNKEEEEKEN